MDTVTVVGRCDYADSVDWRATSLLKTDGGSAAILLCDDDAPSVPGSALAERPASRPHATILVRQAGLVAAIRGISRAGWCEAAEQKGQQNEDCTPAQARQRLRRSDEDLGAHGQWVGSAHAAGRVGFQRRVLRVS